MLLSALLSLLIVFLITPLVKKLAVKFNILDIPNNRKIHKTPVPLLGGLAIYAGVIFGLVFNFAQLQFIWGILIGATVILAVGLMDDIIKLSAQARIICQALAALLMMSFGIHISFLPNNFWGNIGEIILTLVWTIGITNALNYLDGIDGLAAGIAGISSLIFSVISFQTHQPAVCLISLILAASCLGFLPHNFKREKVFLGDAGSAFIGFMLASISIIGNWAEDNVVKLVVPILILGVPIFDMVLTTVMRTKEKKVSTIMQWLSCEGKDHFHHRLIDLGLGPLGAVVFIYLINISFGISAITVSNDRAILGLLSILQAAIIFSGIAVLMVVGRRLSKTA